MSPREKKKQSFFFKKWGKKIPRKIKKIVFFGFLVFVLVVIGFSIVSLPSPKKLSTFPYPASTLIYDRNGKLLYEIYSEKNRVPVKLDEVPESLVWATLAIEDRNFYRHFGFDLRGISRAVYNIIFRKKLQGGSTITQQLVKNALLTPERTWERKIKEAVLTLAAEVIYTKDQILEMYFNQTPYGGTSWGAQAAANTYFDKSVADLSLAQAAMLAGLPASPTRYSPFIHPDVAKSRQHLVLDQMAESGYINKEEAQEAKDEDLNFASPAIKIEAPHFVFYVKEQLVEKYGQAVVDQGGLRVRTTLDLDLQDFSQATVASEVAKLSRQNVSNGAALVTEPKSGEVLAMVGSKDYFASDIDGKFNVTTALRQPGSAIKPINYATGLVTGRVTPATIFNDVPTCFLVPGQKPYCPRNYDGLFHGVVQLRYALGNSFNVPAVKMLAINGLESFIATASAMGIESFSAPDNYGLSLTLGGGEVKMTEMATAFGTLANLGIRQDLVSILEIKDRAGQILEEKKFVQGKRVLPPEVAYLISDILSDNGARSAAFGSRSLLAVEDHPEVAVKTGTTNDKRDNWTVGYTPDYVVTVWVGNNDNSAMSAVASGVTGASPIWNTVISEVLKNQAPRLPARPDTVVGKTVCNQTGFLLPEEGCSARYEYFIKGTEPGHSVALRQPVLVDKDTSQPVQPGEEKENLEWQDHSAVRDPLGTIFCFDCPANIENQDQPWPTTNIYVSGNREPFLAPGVGE
ncbi:MAG: PBP1A family penicillin-binding protein [Candidatus Shapirobacteria bacterium]